MRAERTSMKNSVTRTYAIPIDRWPEVQATVAELDKQAKTTGCVLYMREVGRDNRLHIIGGVTVEEEVIIVEVNTRILYKNWRLIGSIDKLDNNRGNVVMRYDADYDVPAPYFNCSPNCDHCGQNRVRKHTYIIKKEGTNEYKQVGSSCLAEFTGGLSAEVVHKFLHIFDEFERITAEVDERGEEGYKLNENTLIPVQHFIKHLFLAYLFGRDAIKLPADTSKMNFSKLPVEFNLFGSDRVYTNYAAHQGSSIMLAVNNMFSGKPYLSAGNIDEYFDNHIRKGFNEIITNRQTSATLKALPTLAGFINYFTLYADILAGADAQDESSLYHNCKTLPRAKTIRFGDLPALYNVFAMFIQLVNLFMNLDDNKDVIDFAVRHKCIIYPENPDRYRYYMNDGVVPQQHIDALQTGVEAKLDKNKVSPNAIIGIPGTVQAQFATKDLLVPARNYYHAIASNQTYDIVDFFGQRAIVLHKALATLRAPGKPISGDVVTLTMPFDHVGDKELFKTHALLTGNNQLLFRKPKEKQPFGLDAILKHYGLENPLAHVIELYARSDATRLYTRDMIAIDRIQVLETRDVRFNNQNAYIFKSVDDKPFTLYTNLTDELPELNENALLASREIHFVADKRLPLQLKAKTLTRTFAEVSKDNIILDISNLTVPLEIARRVEKLNTLVYEQTLKIRSDSLRNFTIGLLPKYLSISAPRYLNVPLIDLKDNVPSMLKAAYLPWTGSQASLEEALAECEALISLLTDLEAKEKEQAEAKAEARIAKAQTYEEKALEALHKAIKSRKISGEVHEGIISDLKKKELQGKYSKYVYNFKMNGKSYSMFSNEEYDTNRTYAVNGIYKSVWNDIITLTSVYIREVIYDD